MREFNNENIKTFKYLLENISWDNYLQTTSPNDSYNNFDKIFCGVYDIAFPNKTIVIKTKNLIGLWITNG